MFQKTKLCKGLLLAFSGGIALTSLPAFAQQAAETPERIEVTGSRIKRADVEGALPVTTFSRADLEASGVSTIAEFVRTMPFAQAGNYRPQSGSSAAGYAGADLRGMGAERTLILIDGKRAPKAAQIGSASDMNSVPMAAIERVEVLLDGASAIYGSDAIGGVINFITRKDLNGAEFSIGYTDPVQPGGDKREMSGVVGLSGDKGRVFGGFSKTKRGMVFTNQRPWGSVRGASVFGNNAYLLSTGEYVPIPGPDGTCESIGPNFYTNNGLCVYDFNKVAADEQEIETQSIFARGEYQISADWTAYLNTSVSRVDSFGRYASVPGAVFLDADAPGNPLGEDMYLLHRYAAAGNRDDYSTTTVYDYNVGVRGVVAGKVDVDFGVRSYESAFRRLGYNYIVADLAAAAINSGAYDITNPYGASEETLNGMKATISRDGIYNNQEVYASASMPLFKLGGGDVQVFVGAEYREERYSDQYDSLSEAGQILGSAGNSAGGTREVTAVAGELLFPIAKNLEASLSARYEEYSDYGSDFSPKASVKFKPMSNLALRASVGKGFRAPSLDILTQKTTFSAETIEDPRTCAVLPCNADGQIQRDTFFTANPELQSEKSNQFSLGAVWDVTPALSVKLDYWNVKIKDQIGTVTAQEIVDRDNGDDPRAIPSGLGLTRNAAGAITEILAGYANEGVLKTSGLDLGVTGRWKAGGFGEFTHTLQWAHLLEQKDDGDELAGTQGLPKDRAVLSNRWSLGDFDVNWNVNYIGRNGEAAEGDNTKAYTTHDLQVNYSPAFIKGATFTLGALNVTDEMPELIGYDGRNFNFYLYDSYGRQAYVRYTQKF